MQNLYTLVYNRFKRMGYVVLPQVRNHAGGEDIRTADALAISQSSLRKVDFIGFEIKNYVEDFRRELGGVKSDAIAQFCNRWFIVAPKDVIPLNELPKEWGLLEGNQKQIRVVKEAPELSAIEPTREFVATIIRRASVESAVSMEYYRGLREGEEKERERYKNQDSDISKERDRLRREIRTFENASGLTLSMWDKTPTEIGQVVRFILNNHPKEFLERMKDRATDFLKEVEDAEKELDSLSSFKAGVSLQPKESQERHTSPFQERKEGDPKGKV